MKRQLPYGRHLGILAVAYAALAALGVLAYLTANIHVGALAVVPILFIAYYLRQYAALATAFVTGVSLGLLDHGLPLPRRSLALSPLADALILSLALCAVVVVANRLRVTSAANEALRGSWCGRAARRTTTR